MRKDGTLVVTIIRGSPARGVNARKAPMSDAYPIEPVEVEPVDTKRRRICTAIPNPGTVAMIESLRKTEPWCMEGQPPIVWDRAEKATVYDAYGNQWIDMTSGVLIANAGHGRQAMVDAITAVTQKPLLTTYCFPHETRVELTKQLQQVAPRSDDKVMLVSTGSEATELSIKLAREYSRTTHSHKKDVFVTFHNAFHGRTLGAQFAGGVPSLKDWIGYGDTHFVQVVFPDGVRCEPSDMTFDAFERQLADAGIDENRVCGVMTETYQGGNSSFAPVQYIQALRAWCDAHDVILIMDEVQAGFGRTGTFWGFEHYGIVPDLIACGKGISGAMPLSAVIGRKDLLDQFPPGSMTSTHSGNPLCCAGALASLNIILDENLVERAATVGRTLQAGCARIADRFDDVILAHHGRGLVASLHCVHPGGNEPDAQLAFHVVGRAVQQGVMLFAPVGYGGGSVKLSPPLCIEEDAVVEAIQVIEEAFAHVLETRTVS